MSRHSSSRYLIFLAASLTLILSGCGDRITIEKAQQIIVAAKKYPIKKTGTVIINPQPGTGMAISKDEMPAYIKMMANKLMVMNIVGLKNGVELYDVKLTDEGKKYVLEEKTAGDKTVLTVLLGELMFDKIINIKTTDTANAYDVKYWEEISRLTPFGASLIDKPIYDVTSRLEVHNGTWSMH
jgi:hypothetical protein